MLRIIAFLLALMPAAALACNPSNAPPYSAGCEPVVTSNGTSDTLSIWQPGSFPGSANQITVENLDVTANGTRQSLSSWLAQIPGTPPSTGTISMYGTGASTSAIRLTTNGATAGPSNCFNALAAEGYSFSVQLIAQDLTTPANNFAWHLPIGYFSAWLGAASAVVRAGSPTAISNGNISGSATNVSLTADTVNGCLNLSWIPPNGNADTWDVTALIAYARAP